jgi:hypothetical protein
MSRRYDYSDSQDIEAAAEQARLREACKARVMDRLGAAVQMIDLAPMDAYQFPGLVTDEDRRDLNKARDMVAAVRARMRMRR